MKQENKLFKVMYRRFKIKIALNLKNIRCIYLIQDKTKM